MPNWELIISFGDLYEVKWKNNVIFGFLGPKNLYFNIHHVKLVNWKFWPLIGGQRSFVDLFEVKMKKCHFWIPGPKKPIFQHTSCKVSDFKILTSDWRSEVKWWPPRGQSNLFMACSFLLIHNYSKFPKKI